VKRPLIKSKASATRIAALTLALGVSLPAEAQVFLRGTTSEDPIQRVGPTAGDAARSSTGAQRAQSSARGTPPQPAQRARSASPTRNSGAAQADGAPTGSIEAPQDIRIPQARPRQQNFRSLERPPNTAVRQPTGDQAVAQGLPPIPPSPPRRPLVEADPYAPFGLRLGSFQVFPVIDQQIGYDDNPLSRTRGQQRKGAVFSNTAVQLQARSDWARHALSADVQGAYSKYFNVTGADRPEGQATVNGRLDVTRDTAILMDLRGQISTETPGTVNLTGAASERPLTYQYGAGLGVTQRYNRLAVSARVGVDRSTFSDTTLSTGGTLSQEDRNFTQYGLRLRAGYEITPGMIPFVEVLADQRRRDQQVDAAGFRRDSDGLQLRLGSTFELSRILTAEVAAGYGGRRYADARLQELRGPLFEAGLNWSVSPLTTVRLRGTTEFNETTVAGSSGAIARRVSLDVSHALLRNLTLTAGVSYTQANFIGVSIKENNLRGTVGAEYSLNRNLVLRASYAHSRSESSQPNSSISSNIYLFGARLQF
jgi:hypothetical protein